MNLIQFGANLALQRMDRAEGLLFGTDFIDTTSPALKLTEWAASVSEQEADESVIEQTRSVSAPLLRTVKV
jgi:hypothetical protein